MNYHAYFPIDVINGPGTRCTLFVSGCEHRCRGCHNPATWNPNKGVLYTEQLENQILEDLSCTFIPRQGLSLSGGDPLLPNNLSAVGRLVKRVKKELPAKDIWCWTGYERKRLSREQLAVVSSVDVLIDGPFDQNKTNPALIWRGSSNQSIVPVAAWRECLRMDKHP